MAKINFEDAVKKGAGIQSISLAFPSSEAVNIVLTELMQANIVELSIDNHFTTITDETGRLVEQIVEGQEISFKLKKSL